MRKLIVKVLFLFLIPVSVFGSIPDKVFFGLFDNQNKGSIYGTVFLGFFKERFTSSPTTPKNIFSKADQILGGLPLKKDFPALDVFGNPTSITLVQKFTPEPGEYGVLIEGRARSNSTKMPVFFWSNVSLKIDTLMAKKSKITQDEELMFKSKIAKQIQDANAHLREPHYVLFKIQDPIILKPDSEGDIVSILFHIKLKDSRFPDLYDDRGSAFFLYNTKTKKSILACFGHPEWSPDVKGLEVIDPLFFFRIFQKKYFLARCAGPWESPGYAIYELETGRKCLETY